MDNKLFGYYINLDERGSFSADVRNVEGETVFDIKAGNELNEDESSIFDDGFMKDKNDLNGLCDHLKDMGIIPKAAELLMMADFEQRMEEASSPRP